MCEILQQESTNQYQLWIRVFSIMHLDLCDFELCDIGMKIGRP